MPKKAKQEDICLVGQKQLLFLGLTPKSLKLTPYSDTGMPCWARNKCACLRTNHCT